MPSSKSTRQSVNSNHSRIGRKSIAFIAGLLLLCPTLALAEIDCERLADEKLLPKLERATEKVTNKHARQVASFEERGEKALQKQRKKVTRATEIVNRLCSEGSIPGSTSAVSSAATGGGQQPTTTGATEGSNGKCEKAKARLENLIRKEQRLAQFTATKVAEAVARADAALEKAINSFRKRYENARSNFIRKCEKRKGS